ncbi:MAG TPA: GWxTD domain-containing protein [Candidatus Saccharimonadales bacterium]|nr:GWxTD domain-containing protein [Candidatus Saccharimonadales bacterium]
MIRSASPARFYAAAVLLIACGVICAPAAFAKSHSGYQLSDAPTPEWRQGPIRYIITRSEDKEYKDLETEEQRSRFIEDFWRRRDPDPSTPGNEFRAMFWRRVRRANSLYGKETTRPGWVTDMGKIYILLGPPDEISRDEMAEGRRGIVVWTYRNSPGVGPNPVKVGPNQVLAFAQDSSGEYRLTAEPSKLANVWEGLPNPQPPMGLMANVQAQRDAFQAAYAQSIGLTDPVIRAHGGPATGGPLSITMNMAQLQQPPAEWNLNTEVRTREFFGELPFSARADFFRRADGSPEIHMSVALKSTVVTYRTRSGVEEPAVEALGTIYDSTGTQTRLTLDKDNRFIAASENRTAGIDDNLIYQARFTLPPGAYRARLTILDEVSGKSSTSETPFTVPDFGRSGLSLSSVTLARSIGPASGDAPAYRFGNLHVLPRVGNNLAPGGELSFYYQVYGAARSEDTGKPRLDVGYTFVAVGANDETAEIGQVQFTGQEAEAQGYSLSLKDWPAGTYLVRIHVADKVAGADVTRELPFRIVEPGSGRQGS